LTHLKSYQLFEKAIDKFSAAKARKLCPWNKIVANKALDGSFSFLLCCHERAG